MHVDHAFHQTCVNRGVRRKRRGRGIASGAGHKHGIARCVVGGRPIDLVTCKFRQTERTRLQKLGRRMRSVVPLLVDCRIV